MRPPVASALRLARHAIPDPTCRPGRIAPAPAPTGGPPWLAGPGQVARFRLACIREEGFRVCRDVFHPGDFAMPDSVATFRRAWPGGRRRVRLFATGAVQLRLGGRLVHHGPVPKRGVALVLAADDAVELKAVVATRGEPALLRLAGTDADGWEVAVDAVHWQPAEAHPARRDGVPPHLAPLPTVRLRARRNDGLWDFGRTILARPRLPAGVRTITVGESPAEARAGHGAEQDVRLVRDGACRSTAAPVAFRYLRAEGASAVAADAVFAPRAWRGAFACSDRRLDRIWGASAYTLRLCDQGLLLDGVKRDRMPWVGDLALSVLVDAYTFAATGSVRDTIAALGAAGIGRCHLNGIIDYSLWWPVAIDLHRRHAGDDAWSAARWPEVRRLLAELAARRDGDGWLRPRPGDWLFLDWAPLPKDGVVVPLQLLDLWCRRSAAALAAAAGDAAQARALEREADVLAARLRRCAWRAGAWRATLDRSAVPSRHAALLAQLAGAVPPALARGTAAQLLGEASTPVGTPYMAALQELALIQLGRSPAAVQRVRSYWGGMLDQGATTMWEAYDPVQRGAEHLAFYGRPFGKSLCHAWGAGPAMLLPRAVLGLRPLAPGWREAAVAPALGDLDWACATVPTPHGELHVEADRDGCTVTAPRGVTVAAGGRRLPGGRSHRVSAPG